MKHKYRNAYRIIRNHPEIYNGSFETMKDNIQPMSTSPSVQIKLKTALKRLLKKVKIPQQSN
jgi:hypothetical protein